MSSMYLQTERLNHTQQVDASSTVVYTTIYCKKDPLLNKEARLNLHWYNRRKKIYRWWTVGYFKYSPSKAWTWALQITVQNIHYLYTIPHLKWPHSTPRLINPKPNFAQLHSPKARSLKMQLETEIRLETARGSIWKWSSFCENHIIWIVILRREEPLGANNVWVAR